MKNILDEAQNNAKTVDTKTDTANAPEDALKKAGKASAQTIHII